LVNNSAILNNAFFLTRELPMGINYQAALTFARTAGFEVFRVGAHAPGVALQFAAGLGVVEVARRSLCYLGGKIRSNIGFVDTTVKTVENKAEAWTPDVCKDIFNTVVGFAKPYSGNSITTKQIVAATVGAWAVGAVWHDLAIRFIGQPNHTFNLFGQLTGLRVSGDSIIHNVSQLVSNASKLVFGNVNV
jgi:hypothetical protein